MIVANGIIATGQDGTDVQLEESNLPLAAFLAIIDGSARELHCNSNLPNQAESSNLIPLDEPDNMGLRVSLRLSWYYRVRRLVWALKSKVPWAKQRLKRQEPSG